jgi:hypothetical protein
LVVNTLPSLPTPIRVFPEIAEPVTLSPTITADPVRGTVVLKSIVDDKAEK